MIQRPQSLYLLLSATALILLNVFSLYVLQAGDVTVTVSQWEIQYPVNEGMFSDGSIQWLTFFTVFLAGITLAIIFDYKNRKRQMKIVRFLNVGMIVIVAVAAFYLYHAAEVSGIGDDYVIKPGLGLFLPIIALVLDTMAIKGIKKDEDLVRSVDRLR